MKRRRRRRRQRKSRPTRFLYLSSCYCWYLSILSRLFPFKRSFFPLPSCRIQPFQQHLFLSSFLFSSALSASSLISPASPTRLLTPLFFPPGRACSFVKSHGIIQSRILQSSLAFTAVRRRRKEVTALQKQKLKEPEGCLNHPSIHSFPP